MMDDNERDQLERRIGLSLDGRLDPGQQAELEAQLASSAEARALRDAMVGVQAAMAVEPTPEIPAGLRERIVGRVAEARAVLHQHAAEQQAVLPLARRLLLAATLLFGVSLAAWFNGFQSLGNNGVKAGAENPLETVSVEDRLRTETGEDGPLSDYLYWHFLRRER